MLKIERSPVHFFQSMTCKGRENHEIRHFPVHFLQKYGLQGTGKPRNKVLSRPFFAKVWSARDGKTMKSGTFPSIYRISISKKDGNYS